MQPWMKERGKLKRMMTYEPVSFIQETERRRIKRLKEIKGTIKKSGGMELSSGYTRKKAELRHRELQDSKREIISKSKEPEDFRFDTQKHDVCEKTRYGLKLIKVSDSSMKQKASKGHQITRISYLKKKKITEGKENSSPMKASFSRVTSTNRHSLNPSKPSGGALKSVVSHKRMFGPTARNKETIPQQLSTEQEVKTWRLVSKAKKGNRCSFKKSQIQVPISNFQRGAKMDSLEKEKQEAISMLNELDSNCGIVQKLSQLNIFHHKDNS